MGRDCNQRKLGTTFTATITPSGTGFCANETAISGVGTAINGAGTTFYAPRRHHRPQPVLMGVATHAYPESALEALLRSEEHTSELQSRSDLVCRLLLEKKNNSLPTSLR